MIVQQLSRPLHARIMKRQHECIRPLRLPVLVGAGLLVALWIGCEFSLAGDGPAVVQDSERAQLIEALQRQRDRLQQELNQLRRPPEGVAQSNVPRSELSDQPTRSMKESLDSVPGVTVRQGQGARDGNLSIQGAGR